MDHLLVILCCRWWSVEYALCSEWTNPCDQLVKDLLWIGQKGEMGFVPPHQQFLAGCLDGGNILLDGFNWGIDIEATLEEKEGHLKHRSQQPGIIGFDLREKLGDRGQLTAEQPHACFSVFQCFSKHSKGRRLKVSLLLHFPNFYSIIIFKVVPNFCNGRRFYDES